MICFDIETGSVDDAQLALMLPPFEPPPHPGEFDPTSVKVGNLKDADKIAGKIAQARADHVASVLNYSAEVEAARAKHFEAFREHAALSPLTGQVLCIGVFSDGFYLFQGEEPIILKEFWMAWDHSDDDYAGWNIHGFDLPFLIRRSWKHGVKVPERVRNGRYFNTRFVDLMELFKAGSWQEKFVSLNTAAKFLGCGEKTGSGADFAALWQSDRAAAIAYLENDLRLTEGVARRMGVK